MATVLWPYVCPGNIYYQSDNLLPSSVDPVNNYSMSFIADYGNSTGYWNVYFQNDTWEGKGWQSESEYVNGKPSTIYWITNENGYTLANNGQVIQSYVDISYNSMQLIAQTNVVEVDGYSYLQGDLTVSEGAYGTTYTDSSFVYADTDNSYPTSLPPANSTSFWIQWVISSYTTPGFGATQTAGSIQTTSGTAEGLLTTCQFYYYPDGYVGYLYPSQPSITSSSSTTNETAFTFVAGVYYLQFNVSDVGGCNNIVEYVSYNPNYNGNAVLESFTVDLNGAVVINTSVTISSYGYWEMVNFPGYNQSGYLVDGYYSNYFISKNTSSDPNTNNINIAYNTNVNLNQGQSDYIPSINSPSNWIQGDAPPNGLTSERCNALAFYYGCEQLIQTLFLTGNFNNVTAYNECFQAVLCCTPTIAGYMG